MGVEQNFSGLKPSFCRSRELSKNGTDELRLSSPKLSHIRLLIDGFCEVVRTAISVGLRGVLHVEAFPFMYLRESLIE